VVVVHGFSSDPDIQRAETHQQMVRSAARSEF
jgi:hypothetical protein